LQVGQSAIFHVDHVNPRANGGPTTEENLALQCPHCSLHKADRIQAVDPDTQNVVRLFHPLVDAWAEHFAMAVDGTITGKTEVGRATVVALSMNDLWPMSARALQVAAGWLSQQA
jgi:hypothetical protein